MTKTITLPASIEDGEFPIFTVRVKDELFDVDCSNETRVQIKARSGSPAAVAQAMAASVEINRACENVGPRYSTDVVDSDLASIIAQEIVQDAYDRVSVPITFAGRRAGKSRCAPELVALNTKKETA